MIKILFCINSLKNSGGMERVLVNKANYFAKKKDYEISIVTTNQRKDKSFYKLEKNIKLYDLNINYDLDINKGFIQRIFPFLKKQKEHKRKLINLLKKENFDIVISLGCEETFFLPKIKDNSKKIREVHFNKDYRKILIESFNKNFLYKLKALIDTKREENLIDNYDEFIVLTEEDKKKWNNPKVKVIPNSLSFYSEIVSSLKNKKIISVGRLDEQKGYDILIKVWQKIHNKIPEWQIEIYGDGDKKVELQNKIKEYKLEKSFILMGKAKNIQSKYLDSSIYVMSSRYEGFGMVLIEAMVCGLPIVSFDCPCGPKDIIRDRENGYICRFNDLDEMAERILDLANSFDKRKKMGEISRKLSLNYDKNKIMEFWDGVYKNLKN